MKKYCLFSLVIFSITFFINNNIYPFRGDPERSSRTITYNIESYNRGGSFTLEWGGKYSEKGEFEGFIRAINQEGKVLQEITSEKLNRQLENIEILKKELRSNRFEKLKINRGIVSIKKFKEILNDEKKLNSFFEKLDSFRGSLPFDYTITTVWGNSDRITGAIVE